MAILVMFDIDGTLTGPLTEEDACFNLSFSNALGIDHSQTDWSRFQNVTDVGLLIDIFKTAKNREISTDEIRLFQEEYLKLLEPVISNDCRQIEGASSFLHKISAENDFFAAIATGNWLTPAISKLKAAGLYDDLIPMATSSAASQRHEIMVAAENKAKAQYQLSQFDDIFYFGDAVWDAKASHKLGYRFIGITSNLSESKLLKLGAEAAFPNYIHQNHLIRIIRSGKPR